MIPAILGSGQNSMKGELGKTSIAASSKAPAKESTNATSPRNSNHRRVRALKEFLVGTCPSWVVRACRPREGHKLHDTYQPIANGTDRNGADHKRKTDHKRRNHRKRFAIRTLRSRALRWAFREREMLTLLRRWGEKLEVPKDLDHQLWKLPICTHLQRQKVDPFSPPGARRSCRGGV